VFSITSDAANAIAAAPTTRIVAAPAALVSGAGRVPASGRCLISTRASSRAVWDRGVLIGSLLGLIGWVLPPSRMPAAGKSAPEPGIDLAFGTAELLYFRRIHQARGLPSYFDLKNSSGR